MNEYTFTIKLSKEDALAYATSNGWVEDGGIPVDDFITNSFKDVLTERISKVEVDQISKDTEAAVMQVYKDAETAKEQVKEEAKQNIEVETKIPE